MSRTTAICLTALLLGTLGTACARQTGPGTTTLTSGPTGVRTDASAAAGRLADEICGREVACDHVGKGARYRSEEACMSDQGARAPTQIARWTCTPTETHAGFETCLAAIRSEHCDTPLAHADELVACRSAPICGR